MGKESLNPAKPKGRKNSNNIPFFKKNGGGDSFFRGTTTESSFFNPTNTIEDNFQEKGKKKKEGNLPEDLREKMENSLNADFSDVEVHENSSDAKNLNAIAYTQGNEIHFAPGKYQPRTKNGQELLGHELTHVEQQRRGRVKPTIQYKGMPLNNENSLEKEADEKGKKVVQKKEFQKKYNENPRRLTIMGNNVPIQQKEDTVQRDGGTTAAAALAYQITSEVLSSAGGGSDIDLTVDEMTGMFYGRRATAAGRASGTNITTRKTHVFSYLLESVLVRSNLIELKLRMDYEVDDNGTGNISFAIEKIDDAAGWGGRFTANLTTLDSSNYGAVRLTISFDTSGLGGSASGSFTYTIYPFGVFKQREVGDTGDYLGMQDNHWES